MCYKNFIDRKKDGNFDLTVERFRVELLITSKKLFKIIYSDLIRINSN